MPRRQDKRQPLLSIVQPQAVWRPIHYLGSKLRLAEAIRDLVNETAPGDGAVCDLFAGSGTVSMALATTRPVVAADIQEYSRVLCTAILRPADFPPQHAAEFTDEAKRLSTGFEKCLEPLLEFEDKAITLATRAPRLLCDLSEQGSLVAGQPASRELATAVREARARIETAGAELLTTRYFGGTYFSFRQSIALDGLLGAIQRHRETHLAAILSTASAIVNSVGKQFAQPMRLRRKDGTIKSHLIAQMCRDRTIDAWGVHSTWLERYRSLRQERPHSVLHGDYREVLQQLDDVAVIYADPPYTRDHYSRFYHVLETMCLGDSPAVSTRLLSGQGATSRGLYRADRHQSPFCIKTKAPKAFDQLFARANSKPMVLSYSPFVTNGHPRLMTVDAIAAIARAHYSTVEIVTAGLPAHSKLNRADFHRDTASDPEVFLVCR